MSNVQRFGATGDGETDDTEAIRHAIRDGDGMLHFPPGTYRITQPLEIALEKSGPLGIDGTSGTARIVMAGAGPAFRLIGTHGGTGDPSSVKGNVYPSQRLPTIKNIEIEGAHPEADGIEMIQTMQSVFEGILIRRCRHGIHLIERNRNVLISHCHLYHNTGAGVFLDHVNLHQINIASNHISYNRLGGIRIEGSVIRNLQITGNDIEYNNHAQFKTEPEPTAEIYIDTTEPGSSVNEVTVASNTIQATDSPAGCNILIRESAEGTARPPGLWTITGNIIGSQENNVHLIGCYGVTVTGNCIYSGANRNLLIEDSRQINVGSNTFRRHTPAMNTGVRIVRSMDVTLTGCSIFDEHPDGQPTGASLLELVECERINVSGSQMLDGVPCGIDVKNSSHVSITGCTIHDTRENRKSEHAIRFTGQGRGNLIGMNSIGTTTENALSIEERSGVRIETNVIEAE
ncbi:MAG: hypothetical protein CMJ64_25220 [Planctomycetaceae bacterium]|nr:hypothetical protein [Planctomycetaceae bacterium]